jgi:putative ABC transport system permease protein
MIKNNLKIAFRNIQRHKGFSLINISGLAIGMACCLLILLFIRDELRFERFHANADKIYRTIIDEYVDGKWGHNVGSPDLLGPALKEEYPEVASYTRLFNPDWIDKWMVSVEGKYFYEEKLFFADPTLFDVFTFPLLQGNPKTALKDPNSVVITNKIAQKYFGKENPIGKLITIDDTVEAKITGIARSVPENTHFAFDLLVSFESVPYKWALNTWKTQQFYTYILLTETYPQEELDEKLSGFFEKVFGKQTNFKLWLQPIKDIHLHSRTFNNDMAENNSDMAYIYIFATIAVFILCIACINFMNLSTARSLQRAKEVGVRKIMGAHRRQLIKQFLGESFVFSILAGCIALFLLIFCLPIFNALAGKNISMNQKEILFIGLVMAGIAFMTGFLSGSYPSLFLSSFPPIKGLKGHFSAGEKSAVFRRILVIMQFTVSVVLITGTFIISDQIQYCLTKNLGFHKENVVVLPLRSRKTIASYRPFRNTLMKNPSIMNAAGSSTVPGRSVGVRGIHPEGNAWYPRNSIFVDYEFIPTLGIELKEGRNFSRNIPTDVDDAYIVNESAVRKFGWDQAIGKQLIWAGDKNKEGYVIGVVKDFHYKSLHQEIEPLVLHLPPGGISYALVRIASANVIKTMSFIKGKWSKFYPALPFEYFFLDDDFDRLYRSEEKMKKVFNAFTFLAIFISCLGLFGLTSYVLEKRTKEVGIRKVLGASVSRIILMLSKEFTKSVFLANIFASPIVYFAMNQWLQNFAYRIHISLWKFLASASIVMIISLLTISHQSIKAATANPVDALRYE